MTLPNYEKAFLAIEKLADYCLNPFHPVGKDAAFPRLTTCYIE